MILLKLKQRLPTLCPSQSLHLTWWTESLHLLPSCCCDKTRELETTYRRRVWGSYSCRRIWAHYSREVWQQRADTVTGAGHWEFTSSKASRKQRKKIECNVGLYNLKTYLLQSYNSSSKATPPKIPQTATGIPCIQIYEPTAHIFQDTIVAFLKQLKGRHAHMVTSLSCLLLHVNSNFTILQKTNFVWKKTKEVIVMTRRAGGKLQDLSKLHITQ